jgi:sterol desaturase/sphingolipid hydroxylase (fatty acid hydroxylase superfamily)
MFARAALRETRHLPGWLDRVLRVVIVTPDMHRAHHLILRTETDSNYGNLLSVWNRLFRTYANQSAGEPTFGLAEWLDGRPAPLPDMLVLPVARQG